ncbi:MAG: winged helix DNA-binding domain-containing protein, partial [Candidatus Nanopelagicales bacterium]
MTTLTPKRALAMRMSALLLDGESLADPTATVTHLAAMQGQDFGAARWAIAVRTQGSDLTSKRTAIESAFNDGQIVRSWPLRSTVHVVAARDVGWIQRATNARILMKIEQWLAGGDFQGLDTRAFDRLQAVTVEALQGGRRMSRREIFGVWEAAGVAPKKGGGYEFVWALCQRGVTVLGPLGENGDPDLVLADEWVRDPRIHVSDDALRELTRRYFVGHGPATEYDLSWWSGLPVTAVRKGIADAVDKGVLHECNVAGRTMWA